MKFTKCIVPYELSRNHINNGGMKLRMWIAESGREFVRVMAGYEPAGKRGQHIWHISVSVADSPDANSPPTRRPTPVECKAAVELMPEITFERDRSNDNQSIVNHYWEVEG